MLRALTVALGLVSVLTATAVAAPVLPSVGGQVLLTPTAVTGPQGTAFLAEPFLTDARGRGVERTPWLGRPLKVVAETSSTFQLSDGGQRVWLPKRNLAAKAVFPLTRDAETEALAAELGGHSVSFNGGFSTSCRVVSVYYAFMRAQAARVTQVWRVQVDGMNLSPKGGLVDADMVFNERLSSRPVLLVLDRFVNLEQTGSASGGPNYEALNVRARKLVPARCSTLPGLYASADDVRRNLSTAPLAQRPTLPTDPDQAQQALVGWTRAQVLAQYGSPNEPGRLADLLKLPAWTYGEIPYSMVHFDFSPDGRVTKASIARSP